MPFLDFASLHPGYGERLGEIGDRPRFSRHPTRVGDQCVSFSYPPSPALFEARVGPLRFMADGTGTGESIRALARRSDGDGAAHKGAEEGRCGGVCGGESNGGYAHPGEEAGVVTRAAALGISGVVGGASPALPGYPQHSTPGGVRRARPHTHHPGSVTKRVYRGQTTILDL